MPGSITLPQVVLELEEEDRKRYESLKAPTSIVVRYGYMKMVAELPYDGDAKPGCGSKLVVRTRRGTELAEMLTTTCSNGGCGKSVTRKQMLDYIDNSGGRDYPFTDQGKVLRVATVEDLNEQAALDGRKREIIRLTKAHVAELDLPMKLVDVELLLGGDRILFHYTSEAWVDFRELVRRLAADLHTRIEMHQVNARDEARITADYEKCGQHCCCKQFLKVLKPVSMRSAKVQKATLDPTKISGRCGRLMCCLRYEDETYESLRKKLPHRNTRVMTPDGPGTVLDTQILTQLVLVGLDNAEAPAAVPVEHIEVMKDQSRPRPALDAPPPGAADRPRRGSLERTPERPPEREGGPRGEKGTAEGKGGPAVGGGHETPGRDRPVTRELEPRRPTPGAPLRAHEVEAREGEPTELPEEVDGGVAEVADVEGRGGVQGLSVVAGGEADTTAPGADETDEAVSIGETADASDEAEDAVEGGADAGPTAGGAAPGGEGAPGKRRRRRRRRGRGKGGNPSGGGPSAPPAS